MDCLLIVNRTDKSTNEAILITASFSVVQPLGFGEVLHHKINKSSDLL
jgi:hypothetical protein